jgi:hypothetical protein
MTGVGALVGFFTYFFLDGVEITYKIHDDVSTFTMKRILASDHLPHSDAKRIDISLLGGHAAPEYFRSLIDHSAAYLGERKNEMRG